MDSVGRLGDKPQLHFETAATALATFLIGSGAPTDSNAEIDALDALVDGFAALARIKRKRAAGEFDLFLCHNDTDKPEVRAVAERLKEKGYLTWLDELELQPGRLWQRDLQHALSKMNAAAVFVGGSGVGPWQDIEINTILHQFVNRGRSAIPVILPSCQGVPQLPLFLQGHTWVDFRTLVPDPLTRLIWGFTGRGPP